MQADILVFEHNQWSGFENLRDLPQAYQLLLLMGDRHQLILPAVLPQIAQVFPSARIIATSTAGIIVRNNSDPDRLICLAISFSYTPFRIVSGNLAAYACSHKMGAELALQLPQEELSAVLLFSDGSIVNGDELVAGINQVLSPEIELSGAMAGDGDRFEKTLTGVDGDLSEGNVILLGLYGHRIHVSTGMRGGWSLFGPTRTITRSSGNELLEIDGENALNLYKRYLGSFADQLPASALFFPIAILREEGKEQIVRTILGVNEDKGSMIFAGNVPEGSRIRLMRTNTEQVIQMAGEATAEAIADKVHHPGLALLFNCVGRRLVLDSRNNEELESLLKVLPARTRVAGFYSYGEFSRRGSLVKNCELHNQSVVITLIDEY